MIIHDIDTGSAGFDEPFGKFKYDPKKRRWIGVVAEARWPATIRVLTVETARTKRAIKKWIRIAIATKPWLTANDDNPHTQE